MQQSSEKQQQIKALKELNRLLKECQTLQEIFGKPDSINGIDTQYKELAKLCHPDRFSREYAQLATKTFYLLTEARGRAETQIVQGQYGKQSARDTVKIQSKLNSYSIIADLDGGDYANCYKCSYDKGLAVLKVSKSATVNHLMEQEIGNIRGLLKVIPEKAKPYFPNPIETFCVNQGGKRSVYAVEFCKNCYSVEQIRTKYKEGLHPKDAVWMINRLFEGLVYTHEAGYINGAVIPSGFVLNIENHGGILTEWGYGVKIGNKITHISTKYRDWYPPEVVQKLPVGTYTDIYMAAKMGIYLIRPYEKADKLLKFLSSCTIYNPHRRPTDTRKLYEELQELLKEVYGKREFRKFEM